MTEFETRDASTSRSLNTGTVKEVAWICKSDRASSTCGSEGHANSVNVNTDENSFGFRRRQLFHVLSRATPLPSKS